MLVACCRLVIRVRACARQVIRVRSRLYLSCFLNSCTSITLCVHLNPVAIIKFVVCFICKMPCNFCELDQILIWPRFLHNKIKSSTRQPPACTQLWCKQTQHRWCQKKNTLHDSLLPSVLDPQCKNITEDSWRQTEITGRAIYALWRPHNLTCLPLIW